MLIKRIFDIICALLGLTLLSPVFIIISIIIKLTTKGPILFNQIRVGRFGKRFYIHKFRTMIANAESMGLKITVGADSRITSIGKILRKTKLDELPQLYDVLIGNMSFVGPRPEVPLYVDTYLPEIKQIVLSVRPGITELGSLAMINESEILAKESNPNQFYIDKILPEKLAYAVKYVKTRTFLGDIKIILKTLIKIYV